MCVSRGPSIKDARTRGGRWVSLKRTHADTGGGGGEGQWQKVDVLKFKFLPTSDTRTNPLNLSQMFLNCFLLDLKVIDLMSIVHLSRSRGVCCTNLPILGNHGWETWVLRQLDIKY